MAKLFKDRLIKEKVENLDIAGFEPKIAIIQRWLDSIKNGTLQQKTETQCEQSFNQSFFIDILGYIPFPNEVYTIDPKAYTEVSAQKPDATLGYFTSNNKRVVAVVEIKDVNTPLDRPQRREGNLSPVQQAFKYKPQYKECDFVIATNFNEIRIYKDTQLDYELFTLEGLLDPSDDYYQFKKFFYLLNHENFISAKGKTETLSLLSEIRIEQEAITNKFYKEYKNLRNDLIKNIIKNNKESSKRSNFYNIAVENAQKIIDRIVLVSFFEDLGLLPENKLKEVVDYADKGRLDVPVWDTMKNFFRAIDTGSEKLGIPNGYNGELFKNDEELNNLIIDDEICKSFVEFGKYDFAEDLSVNILGHIFEQSISDLERLKEFAGSIETDKKSKRKKDGIFYTPEYIVDSIVKNSIQSFLTRKQEIIFSKYKLKADLTDKSYDKRAVPAFKEYQECLRKIKVVDPACGSGAFLVKVFDFLLEENKRISDIIADLEGTKNLFNSEDYIKSLLKNNIYGVDLNPESVEITKLSLWLKSARKGEKLVSLKNNIKCGNSLISDKAIAGNHAFNWLEEFPDVMSEGGFDIIVGNPPWGSKISIEDGRSIATRFNTDTKNLNLFAVFFNLAFEILHPDGIFEMLIPKVFIKNATYFDLRKMLIEEYNLLRLVDFGQFPGVASDAVSVSFSKSTYNDHVKIFKFVDFHEELVSTIKQDIYSKNSIYAFSFDISEEKQIILQIMNEFKPIEQYCKIKRGIELGQVTKLVECESCGNFNELSSKYYSKEQNDCKHCGKKLNKQNPINISSRTKDSFYTRATLSGREISRYLTKEYYYIPEALKGIDYKEEIFKTERIFVKRISTRPEAVYIPSTEGTLSFNTIYSLYNFVEVNPYVLTAVLNSRLMHYYYEFTFNLGMSLTTQITIEYLKKLPISILKDGNTQKIEENVLKVQKLNRDIYDTKNRVLLLIFNELNITNIPDSIKDFESLNFDLFSKKLNLEDRSFEKKEELLIFYEDKRMQINKLIQEVNKLDLDLEKIIQDSYKLDEPQKRLVNEWYSSIGDLNNGEESE